MDTLKLHYEQPKFTVENNNSNPRITNTYNQQSISHCQKCGRRTRNYNINMNNRRIINEQHRCRHGHLLKYKRQQCHFPTELPSYSIINQTNDNHLMTKNTQNRKSNKKNILIDQLIQVQQLNDRKCDYNYDIINNYKNDQYEIFTDTINKQNSNKLQQVQQMIYLRENINNLTYREIHFPNEYIILKRLEEKNNLINQKRFKVDHYFRSLKLQYQIKSMLFQDITITSFIYSKQDSSQTEFIIKTPFKRCSISENIECNQNTSNDLVNHSILPTKHSFPTITEIHNKIDNPINSSIDITPYNEYKQEQYSQNASHSYLNTNYLKKHKKNQFLFDTAVIIDVNKCPQISPSKSNFTHHSLIPQNSNYIKPTLHNEKLNNKHLTRTTCSMPLIKNNEQELSSIYFPDSTIYYNQYSEFMNIYQPNTMFLPYSQNSNYTHQQQISTDSIFNHPIYNESFSNIPNDTNWFPSNCKELNEYQSITINHLSPTNSPVQNIIENPSSKSQFTSSNNSQRSLSVTNINTASNISTNNINTEENNQSIKYTETINKIKQILNNLKKNLLSKSEIINKKINISFPSISITPLNMNQTSNKIDKSISTIITSDSLISNTSIQTTYSVSSTLPILNKNYSQLPYNKSIINVENEILKIELDSHNNNNNNHYLNRIKFLNSAKNINSNQQTSEDDETRKILTYTRSRLRRSTSHHVIVQYMSPSFMFVLQILLVTCLINQFFLYYFFDILPTDTFDSIIVDNSQSVTPTSSTFIRESEQTIIYTINQLFYNFFLSFFKLVE